MFALSKVPRGLLELLRLRTDGRMPDLFNNAVQPCVDSTPFYGSDLLIPASSTPTVGALNPALVESLTTTALVSVLSLGGQLTIGAAAATNIQVGWGVLLPGQTVDSILGSQFLAQQAIGAIAQFGSSFNRLVLPIGSTLYVIASGTAAGADHSLRISGVLENLTGTGT